MNKERLYEKLEDYNRASSRLNEATKLKIEDDIIFDGVIQRFEFTFELSWKLMKMFLEATGISDIKSPRGAIREAYAFGLIEDGNEWINMMIDRNKTSHLYDEEEARLIYEKIKNRYKDLFLHFGNKVEEEIEKIN
ncbi:nucleotidyltransferase substrate binding protein [Virgibacillus sp. NKC19-16]|uniref:nucleotidyltransferase substrate binding protein n=1 Tax=Virgibacillus salidurans TaxID=2831673 RepID=UPI001F1BBD45|nr:nucleotidyltransferase substrate binding protein [Virgibacillus sp. NKC19-16]UJL47227.1 nucleotidyltransferase substrate binding protein [Virgibacillus sp. NKC19-16]